MKSVTEGIEESLTEETTGVIMTGETGETTGVVVAVETEVAVVVAAETGAAVEIGAVVVETEGEGREEIK